MMLYCIVLYCIALHCIALHCIALYCIVLYCIVRIHLHGLYQHFIPRNLFAYFITYKYQQDGVYSRAHVKIITQIKSI